MAGYSNAEKSYEYPFFYVNSASGKPSVMKRKQTRPEVISVLAMKKTQTAATVGQNQYGEQF
ncbi:hypothetical protein QMA77_24085 [Pantoea ananatis]|uniref:hypothetical protein n=2 Tax=Pantoea TaxID=53335 RepID=UPI0024AE7399|nr:hypothetical protein [Pantoea ananatis]MDI6539993.1 hypothetical protein [Pantoea ananatis]